MYIYIYICIYSCVMHIMHMFAYIFFLQTPFWRDVQRQGAEAILLQRTCLEILHHDVAGFQQPLHDLLALGKAGSIRGLRPQALEDPGKILGKILSIGVSTLNFKMKWPGTTPKNNTHGLHHSSLAPGPEASCSSVSQSFCSGSARQSRPPLAPRSHGSHGSHGRYGRYGRYGTWGVSQR